MLVATLTCNGEEWGLLGYFSFIIIQWEEVEAGCP